MSTTRTHVKDCFISLMEHMFDLLVKHEFAIEAKEAYESYFNKTYPSSSFDEGKYQDYLLTIIFPISIGDTELLKTQEKLNDAEERLFSQIERCWQFTAIQLDKRLSELLIDYEKIVMPSRDKQSLYTYPTTIELKQEYEQTMSLIDDKVSENNKNSNDWEKYFNEYKETVRKKNDFIKSISKYIFEFKGAKRQVHHDRQKIMISKLQAIVALLALIALVSYNAYMVYSDIYKNTDDKEEISDIKIKE